MYFTHTNPHTSADKEMNSKQAIVTAPDYRSACFPLQLSHDLDKRECVLLFFLQRMHEVHVENPDTPTEVGDEEHTFQASSTFIALLYKLYMSCQKDTIVTPYLKRKKHQYHTPYFEARNDNDEWSLLSFEDRVDRTMLFCASLFTSDPNVEESCFDVDECQVVMTTATQHPQYDICHLLYSELLVEHILSVARSRMVAPREAESGARRESMMRVRQSLFQHRTVRLNNMMLTCMLLAMNPAIATRNMVTHRSPGNEVFTEEPAFACDLSYMSVPTGEPRQISTLKCDVISQFIHFVDLLRQGSMFANSSAIEALLLSEKYSPDIEGGVHIGTDDDYIGASVLFSHRPSLTKGMIWLALLVELMPPNRTRFMTQYLFMPQTPPPSAFTLIILAHNVMGLELPNGDLIPYTDPVALATDCAYYLRHDI